MSTEQMAGRRDAIAREARGEGAWRTSRRAISLENPVLMGVLNITPDSFSAVEAAVERFDLAVSVDTTKADVARAALDAGAEIINDISGLRFDPELASLAARSGAGLALMHIRGRPRSMQQDIHYDDLLGEIASELQESVDRALAAGCERERIVIDPGIGFGKTAEQNLVAIDRLDRFRELGFPILIGPSRKSFIGKTLGLDVEDRLEATLAACVVALMRGARIFRVHDVAAARRALDMAEAIIR